MSLKVLILSLTDSAVNIEFKGIELNIEEASKLKQQFILTKHFILIFLWQKFGRAILNQKYASIKVTINNYKQKPDYFFCKQIVFNFSQLKLIKIKYTQTKPEDFLEIDKHSMNKPLESLPKKSICISKIINELPCKKNPFLAIAYPSAIEIKDRSNYSNDYQLSVSRKQHDTFMLQGDSTHAPESLDSIKTKNTSINEEFMSVIQNENLHFLSITEAPIQPTIGTNTIKENDQPKQSETQYQKKQSLTELTSNQIQINLSNQLKHETLPKQYGVIVKNLYKRNHLTRKSTFQSSFFQHSEKQNTLLFIANKFNKKSQKSPIMNQEQPEQDSQTQLDTNQQCLTERGKQMLRKIIPFFN